jgi:hypothetical protein
MFAKRLSIYIIKDVKRHFTDFNKCIRKWPVCIKDVFNFNESSF